jgi:hypothetical protein
MIKKGRHIIKSHMTLEYEFTGIRIQGGFLTPVDWTLSVNLIATGKKGKEKEEIEHQASLTYQKLYFWLDTNLPSVAVVNVGDEDDLYIANLSSNIMVYCPGNPSDDMIIQLLHSKLSVLAAPDLIVAEIKLKGSDTSLQYTYDCDDGNYDLPLTTSDYYTEGVARDVEPWWTRNDGFCFEFIRPADEEGKPVEGDEVFEGIVDPMIEFDKMVEEADMHVGLMREPARIVQVEKWKPKKVEE